MLYGRRSTCIQRKANPRQILIAMCDSTLADWSHYSHLTRAGTQSSTQIIYIDGLQSFQGLFAQKMLRSSIEMFSKQRFRTAN